MGGGTTPIPASDGRAAGPASGAPPLRPWRVALACGALWLAAAGAWIAAADSLIDPGSDRLTAARWKWGVLFAGSVLAVGAAAGFAARRSGSGLEQARSLAARLLEQERRWRYLMENLDEVVWFADADATRPLEVSDATSRIYGYPARAFLDDPRLWQRLVHPEDAAALRAGGEALMRAGARTLEFRMRHADGSWRWVRDRALVLHDAAGRRCGIGGISQDVTERREAERRLHASRAQLAGLIEAALDAIVGIDAERRIRVFNRAAACLFGVEADAAIGQPIETYLPALAAAPAGDARVGPTEARRADGRAFPIEASISVHDAAAGGLTTIVVRDRSEQLAAEAARRDRAEAEAASAAKTEFLSRMSHELRTPLNAMLGFAQLLALDRAALTAAQREHVEQIEQAGWHLLALIDDVLDVARIEAGHLTVTVEPVDVERAIGEVLEMSSPQARAAGVTLARPPGERSTCVLADPLRLRQVLLNLLSNAIKYNRPGGRVEVRTALADDRLEIEVADDGIGMTREQLAHLYEPFNRLGRQHGHVGGTGIGLALTRRLVLLMEASLQIDSEAGQGTRARLALPLARAAAAASVDAPDAAAPAGAPMRAAEATLAPDDPEAAMPAAVVLCIEDNPVNLLIVEHLVARWPALRLVPAVDGTRGLELARALRPDLVLLDMRLPDLDGIEVLRRLRADPLTAELRIIALSASALPEEIENARAVGADDYWFKPLAAERFDADLRRVLGGAVAAARQAAAG